MKKTELLAPVGSFEALVAAVQNGADAVYLGGKKFGARQYANNFDEDALKDAVEYCHIRDVKIYITVNTLVHNEEFNEFIEYIRFLYNIDVDAIIIQDLGVLKAVREKFPDFEIHASTQMTIHNLEGVKLLKSLGVKRTVVAREMKLKDIENIKEKSDMEVEVFVHGALCICYSGQCLMSSLIGGRSGNRGRCAQPCRLPYKLIDLETKEEVESPEGDYILSPRDLNTLEDLDKLLKLGVHSLKIEGRMKRPEYVATVVKAYRKAIDMYYRDGEIKIDNKAKYELFQIFNRKFTKGHIFEEKNSSLMAFEKPGNRGIEIGHVINYDQRKRRAKIKLENELYKGDGIEIRNRKRENRGIKIRKIFRDNKVVENGLKGDIVEIEFKGKVLKGDIVFKTSDIKLLGEASESYKDDNISIKINGALKGKIGEVFELYIWDHKGNYVSTKGNQKIEKAINKSLSKERILKQLKKLGNTPYSFEKVEIDIDENIAASISDLNNLRREAVEGLNNLRKNINRRDKINLNTEFLQRTIPREKSDIPSLSVYINNLEQLEAIIDTEIDIIYYSNISDMEKAFDMVKRSQKLLIPALERITSDTDIEAVKKKKHIITQNNHLLLANHGQLNIFKEEDVKIHTDFSFNIFNSIAANKMKNLNVKNITLSPELNLNQIKDLISKTNIDCQVIAYGHLPMMITEYCPINALTNNKDCDSCRNKKYGLKDRYGIIFPLQRDSKCRIQILNSKKLLLLDYMDEIVKSNVANIRLQFTNEDKNEIINIATAYSKTLQRVINGEKGVTNEIKDLIKSYKDKGDYTRGHFSRGVI